VVIILEGFLAIVHSFAIYLLHGVHNGRNRASRLVHAASVGRGSFCDRDLRLLSRGVFILSLDLVLVLPLLGDEVGLFFDLLLLFDLEPAAAFLDCSGVL